MGRNPPRISKRHCVVWHQPDAKVSQALAGALESRDLRVETSSSGHEVFAMGCRDQQRMDQSRAGLIVVLDAGDPELPDQSRVLESLERFAPSALVWIYQEGANPPLRGLVQKETKAESKSGIQDQPDSTQLAESRPPLRLAGTNETSKQPLRASDVLEQDELSALLKPDEQA